MKLLNSKETMVKRYNHFITNYQDAINAMEVFILSDFVKKRNITFFLSEHIKFAKNAKEILEEAIIAIKTDTVKKDVCLRLDKMIKACRKEHENIEDTYGRVKHEHNMDYYNFQEALMKFREICDELEYLDETVEEIRSMINDSKIVIENSSNIQIQQNTNDSSLLMQNMSSESIDVDIVKNILSLIEENFQKIELGIEKNTEIVSQIRTIETQLKSGKPKREIIFEGFKTIRNLLEGATGSLIAAGLIHNIGLFK